MMGGWFLLLIMACLISLSILLAAISLAPFVPARKKDLVRIMEVAGLKPGEVFYDLGCGNGRVVFQAGKMGARAVGIELAWPLFFYCWIKKILTGAKKVTFKFGDLYKKKFGEADVVYVFGMAEALGQEKFKTKMKNELKPGARVVSYAFPIAGWSASAVDKPNEKEVAIYLYTINN